MGGRRLGGQAGGRAGLQVQRRRRPGLPACHSRLRCSPHSPQCPSCLACPTRLMSQQLLTLIKDTSSVQHPPTINGAGTAVQLV